MELGCDEMPEIPTKSTSVPIDVETEDDPAAATSLNTKHRVAKDCRTYADPDTCDEVGSSITFSFQMTFSSK